MKLFKVNAPTLCATHGMTRDPNGIIWPNINNGQGGVAASIPIEKIDVFLLPPVCRHRRATTATTTARAASGPPRPMAR